MPSLPSGALRPERYGFRPQALEKLIAYTQNHGLQRLNGITMPNNKGMIGLARKLGFSVDIQLEDGIVSLSLQLVPEQLQTAGRNC